MATPTPTAAAWLLAPRGGAGTDDGHLSSYATMPPPYDGSREAAHRKPYDIVAGVIIGLVGLLLLLIFGAMFLRTYRGRSRSMRMSGEGGPFSAFKSWLPGRKKAQRFESLDNDPATDAFEMPLHTGDAYSTVALGAPTSPAYDAHKFDYSRSPSPPPSLDGREHEMDHYFMNDSKGAH